MTKVGAVDRDSHGVWWEEVAAKVEATVDVDRVSSVAAADSTGSA